MLHITCCTSHTARHILHITRCTSHAAHDMLHVTYCTSHSAHHTLHITCCTRHAAHHMLHITCSQKQLYAANGLGSSCKQYDEQSHRADPYMLDWRPILTAPCPVQLRCSLDMFNRIWRSLPTKTFLYAVKIHSSNSCGSKRLILISTLLSVGLNGTLLS